MLPLPSDKLKQHASSSRQELDRFCQIVTGHCRLRKHMSQWREGIEPTCRKCGEGPEEPLHFRFDCPAVEEQRFQWINMLDKANLDTADYNALSYFFEEIGYRDMLIE